MQEGKKIVRCLGCMERYEAFDSICPHCGYVNGTPPSEQYHLVPGTILHNKYLLGRVLGYGGFGVTYIAWDEILQRKVAVKEYMPRECASRMAGTKRLSLFSGERTEQFHNGLEAFKEEASKLMKLHDLDGTVRLFDLFEENGTAYLVMEYLDGENLAEVLKEKGKIPVEEALELLVPIMKSLKEIHGLDLIHRDISPDNIFLTKSGEVKLLDFGSARYSVLAQNKSMSVIIKQGYAPPEQYQVSRDQGPWTDVYSLAATFYTMITGEVPEDAISRMVKDNLKFPSQIGIDITKNQEHALLNALNTKVSSRTQSIEAFKEQLFSEDYVPRISNEDGKPIKEKKSYVPFVLTGIAILGIIAGTVFFIRKPGTKEEITTAGKENKSVAINYIGADYENAEQEAEEEGLTLVVKNKKNTDAKEGTIIEQSPEAGKVVTNDTITVILSAGDKKSKMPGYVGYSEKKSTEIAKKNHLILSVNETEESNVIPGFVVKQAVEAGKKVPKGSAVSLVLSAGRSSLDTSKKIKMDLLEGKTFKEALKVAENKGFYLGIDKHEYSVKTPKGTICQQSKEKGKEIAQGTEVKVIISDGPEQMKVPKVISLSEEEAKAALEKQKLKYNINYSYNDSYGSEYNAGVVMDQSVEPDKYIDEGSEITLTVSRGAKPKETPTEAPKKSSGSSSKKRKSGSSKKKSRSSGKKSKSSGGNSMDDWVIMN